MFPAIRVRQIQNLLVFPALFLLSFAFAGCQRNDASEEGKAVPLPALALQRGTAVVSRDYPARIEGKVNVEIRPQVDGMLEKIYVEEGSQVTAGQRLFLIDSRLYREQYNQAVAAQKAAEAAYVIAKLDVDKLVPLVKNKVVSDIQLKTARASLQSAEAAVEQARAATQSARINLGHAVVTAPVSGYIGTIPFRTGSLLGRADTRPLTVLSDVREVYAYFSMSESDFIEFRRQYPGESLEEKVSAVPPVSLLLSDGSRYSEKGLLAVAGGQFDEQTAAIAMRAVFPNDGGFLRTGNTGKVRLETRFDDVLLIPQAATVEIQDKVFVFRLDRSGKAHRIAFSVLGKSGNHYIAGKELRAGDVIVTSGLGRLREGMTVKPVFAQSGADKRTRKP